MDFYIVDYFFILIYLLIGFCFGAYAEKQVSTETTNFIGLDKIDAWILTIGIYITFLFLWPYYSFVPLCKFLYKVLMLVSVAVYQSFKVIFSKK